LFSINNYYSQLSKRSLKEAYKNIFGKDMVQDIRDDTSGDYQRILAAIASGN
jgi:hypothetical protein